MRDGHLNLDGRCIPWAPPLARRLAGYLEYRRRHWPSTSNPDLFIHFRTAAGTAPVGYRWVNVVLGPNLRAQALREDRILDEAQATRGGMRRLIDLFGISANAAGRYASTGDHPAFLAGAHEH